MPKWNFVPMGQVGLTGWTKLRLFELPSTCFSVVPASCAETRARDSCRRIWRLTLEGGYQGPQCAAILTLWTRLSGGIRRMAGWSRAGRLWLRPSPSVPSTWWFPRWM